MDVLIDQLPKFADLLQKAGVIGLLLIVCGVLIKELMRMRKEAARLYAERDGYRLAYAIYKGACDNHQPPIKPDLSALQQLPTALQLGVTS